jgi:hypothetical protein
MAEKELGMKIGRPCCGGRTMCFSRGEENIRGTFSGQREFKGWHCSVNWFFFHIEQQTGKVFHHQTCQAQFGETRGPIGTLEESDKILEELERNLKNETMPTIICPKRTCGCGLCAPKSSDKEEYKKVFFGHLNNTSPFNNTLKV